MTSPSWKRPEEVLDEVREWLRGQGFTRRQGRVGGLTTFVRGEHVVDLWVDRDRRHPRIAVYVDRVRQGEIVVASVDRARLMLPPEPRGA